LQSSYSGQIVTQYIVTAAMKLTTRLKEPAQVERLRRLLQNYRTNLDVEIQQRAAEYSNLFAYDEIRRGVLERMPPPEIREEQRVFGEATKKSTPKKKKPSQMSESDMLLDLMGDDASGPSSVPAVNGSQNNADLLADILGGGSSAPAAAQASAPQRSNVDSIMDLFNPNQSISAAPAAMAASSSASADLLGGFGAAAPAAATPAATNIYPAYDRNGLQITFQTQRNQQAVQALARFRNSGGSLLNNVSLQAAVPRAQKLQLQQISSSSLAPGAEATQQLRVTHENQVRSCRHI
jgi:AP-1 complex subunit gamma-1